jgi:hypothetical protein
MATTVSPDQYDYNQMVAARQQTPETKMSDALMSAARRFTLTAAPPAHIRPTPFSDSFDLTTTIALPAAVSAYQIALTYTVPKGRGGRLEQYGVSVQDPTYTYNGSILWAFRLNGAFVPNGMSNWGEQRGSSVFPRKTVFNLNFGDKLDFLIMRAVLGTNGTQNVQMNMRGWTYRMRNTYQNTQASSTAY